MNPSRLAIALLCIAPAGHADPEPAGASVARASIPFVQYGGVRNWRADGDRGMWIQDSRRNWYYATFLGPCFGVNFATTLGFDTRPVGTFDRFTTVFTPDGGRCAIKELTTSEGPPPRRRANPPPRSG